MRSGLLFLLVNCCAGSYIIADPKIVGGQDIDIKDAPYQVQVENQGRFICGGSIYKSSYVITAAHCFDNANAEDITIRAGTSLLRKDGVVFPLSQLIRHEQYDPTISFDYDIAIVEIAGEFEEGETISALGLTSSEPTEGTVATISGWGALYEDGSPTYQLQAVQVPVMDRETCRASYEEVEKFPYTERMMCAGEEGKDACQGDSGGPLVVDNQLVGIASFGYGCGQKFYPGVYANVANLLEWIDSKTTN